MTSRYNRLSLLLTAVMTIATVATTRGADHPLAGDWSGALQVSTTELRLVVHLTAGDDGSLGATLDSPDQGAAGIPVQEATFTDGTLVLNVAAVGGRYEGTLSDDGQTIDGTWSQGGMSLPLKMTRGGVEAPKRPQEPVEPFPYDVREVSYENEAAAGVSIAGTLTTPRNATKAPAVLLISGSGPQDRDESIMGHRPFLVLADHLTRRGIAVLRVDDRGVGESTGDFSTATSQDFASDVRAGVAFLKTQAGIDPDAVGLIGHSEGGVIAPIVAANGGVAFIVLLAGPGTPGEEILLDQGRLIVAASGGDDDALAQQRSLQEDLFGALRNNPDDSQAADAVRDVFRKALESASEAERAAFSKEAVELQVRQLVNPWMRFFLTHDPRPSLSRVKCPVLAICGGKDLQVPAQKNLAEIEKAVKSGGNNAVTTRQFDGLNHLFQPSETGLPAEYGRIEQTMAPEVMQAVSAWVIDVAVR